MPYTHDILNLYHYYECCRPPFLALTALPYDKARAVLVSQNTRIPDLDNYLTRRYAAEENLRRLFIERGGRPRTSAPIYMTLGPNKGLTTWFRDPAFIKIPVDALDPLTVSFTYGDSMPVFKPELDTGEEWWGKVYFYNEIVELLDKYGLPEDPEYDMSGGVYPKGKSIRDYLKYIEAHVWSAEPLIKYR